MTSRPYYVYEISAN